MNQDNRSVHLRAPHRKAVPGGHDVAGARAARVPPAAAPRCGSRRTARYGRPGADRYWQS
jgi:hypothetical protein